MAKQNRRYSISQVITRRYVNGIIVTRIDYYVTDKHGSKTTKYIPQEFINGQGLFNNNAWKLPLYIHDQLWGLHRQTS